MKGFMIVIVIFSFLLTIIALKTGDYGYSLGLFGGACAWLMLVYSQKERK
jgi:hypothetical protein